MRLETMCCGGHDVLRWAWLQRRSDGAQTADERIMTLDQLKTLGELMYGPRWKTDMANDLGVDRHIIIGWINCVAVCAAVFAWGYLSA
jgi:hypothetical protein